MRIPCTFLRFGAVIPWKKVKDDPMERVTASHQVIVGDGEWLQDMG